MDNIRSEADTKRVLDALGDQLVEQGEHFEIVVIGGAALLALGVIDRPTRDIDVVALRGPGGLEPAEPLPATLAAARDRVARVLGLAPDWLNAPQGCWRSGSRPAFSSGSNGRTMAPA